MGDVGADRAIYREVVGLTEKTRSSHGDNLLHEKND